MTPTPPSIPPGPPRRRHLLVGCLALGFCLLVYLGIGPLAGGAGSAANPNGYYALLTEGFLSGHTYLKTKPDPALKLLDNPWAGYQGIPRLHDATYYKDRYYLYFSFVPAVCVGIPWKLLTGHYLNDGAMSAICGSLGLLLGGFLLLRLWRRWFSDLSPGWLIAGLLLFGLGSNIPALLQNFDVYPVPISGAFACSMAALGALFWAITTPHPRRQLFALALASLAWGLEVACRPNHLISVAALGLAVLILYVGATRRHGLHSPQAWRILAAGTLPVAGMGAIIAAYNYVRFGSITDFGIINMFSGGDSALFDVVSLRNVPGNLHTILFQTGIYSPYFPFLTLPGPGLGIVPGNPLVLVALAWPLTLLSASQRRDRAWLVFSAVLALAFLLNLLGVAMAPGINERYRGDFMPTGVLLSLLTGYGLLRIVRERIARRPIRLLWAGGFAAIGAWSLAHAVILLFVHYAKPEKIQSMARWINGVPQLVEQMKGVRFGAATMTVRFPNQAPGVREPLLSSGKGRDIVYVDYLRDNRIQIGFFHEGAGGPVSEPLTVKADTDYRLTLDLGCLYPPTAHPLYREWPPELIPLVRQRLRVLLDDRPLIDTGSAFYPSHADDIYFGHHPGANFAPGKFTGTLGIPTRVGLPAPAVLAAPGKIDPVRLTVRFPAFTVYRTEPLVSTGRAGAGEILYVSYVAPGKLRFGHDAWNGGSIETAIVDYDHTAPQTVEVSLPVSTAAADAPTGRFLLRHNGALLMADDRPHHASLPAEVYFGFNGCGSSAVAMNFTGHFERVEKIAALSLTAERFQTDPGPVRLVLRFPVGLPGRSEPLLVTGRAGAADVLFVHYVDANHIRIGYDHWSVGGPVSDPISIDYAATHSLEMTTGALYPAPEDDAAWAGTPAARRTALLNHIVVKLNGQTVFQHQQRAFRSEPVDILAGLNAIGASTCARLFTGRIFVQERLGLPAAAE